MIFISKMLIFKKSRPLNEALPTGTQSNEKYVHSAVELSFLKSIQMLKKGKEEEGEGRGG